MHHVLFIRLFPILFTPLGVTKWECKPMRKIIVHLQLPGWQPNVYVACNFVSIEEYWYAWHQMSSLRPWGRPLAHLVARWAAEWRVERSILLWGNVSSQIHLISPGCPRPNSALTVHKSGLKHRSSSLRPDVINTELKIPCFSQEKKKCWLDKHKCVKAIPQGIQSLLYQPRYYALPDNESS